MPHGLLKFELGSAKNIRPVFPHYRPLLFRERVNPGFAELGIGRRAGKFPLNRWVARLYHIAEELGEVNGSHPVTGSMW